MPSYTQAEKGLSISTPIGKDILLITSLRGYEAISQPYHFDLELISEMENEIYFDELMGQSVTVEMQLGAQKTRYFNGIVRQFNQGGRDDTFCRYRAEIVPVFWLLKKTIRSRVFQHLSVPDILNKVLTGFEVAFELGTTYSEREYCVQYHESDFDFASRLMEDEGIHYFFNHADGSHRMLVTDWPNKHPKIIGTPNVSYDETLNGAREEARITSWEKTQQLCSDEYTLWDHSFQLPGNHLEGKEAAVKSVAVGSATHKLKPLNQPLEIYDYPGGYAKRFDGIDAHGIARPQTLDGVLTDRQRTARVRIELEEAGSLKITGASDCAHFAAGHQFQLEQHPDGDDEYLLTRVEHHASAGNYRSSQNSTFSYDNRFTCMPVALPYRPPRETSKPQIAGIQTATVVGPAGEEIFCDKYGRVKVQFHWDREGKRDADSSCWLRVAQFWAGNGWGAFFWPRIGHEVVVAFEEGDPDQPLVIGSVYNAKNMPPFQLPLYNQLGGLKSASLRGTAYKNFNGVIFDDTNGKEHLAIHSERHMSFNSELDKLFHSGRHKAEKVSHVALMTVGSLPTGGGSGGGDPYDAWPPPDAHGVGGLNAITVYGENLQSAVGLNHQVAIGSNLQVCINPGGLAAGIGVPSSPIISGLMGSGLGGNMQFTVGTSANFVFGQSFDLNIGPKKIETAPGEHPDTVLYCKVLTSVYLIWMFLYAAVQDNASKCAITLVCQGLIDLLINYVLKAEITHVKEAEEEAKRIKEEMFKMCIAPDDADDDDAQAMDLGTEGFCTGLAILLAAVAPAAADIVTAARDKNSSS